MKNDLPRKPLLSPSAVGEMLGISSRKIQEMCQSGALPACKIGAVWRIAPADVDDLLRRGSNVGSAAKKANVPLSWRGAFPSAALPDPDRGKKYAEILAKKPSKR